MGGETDVVVFQLQVRISQGGVVVLKQVVEFLGVLLDEGLVRAGGLKTVELFQALRCAIVQ